MSKTKYICHHCNKEYSRKIYFDRHLLCCNLKALAMEKGSVELEEMNDTPSQRELYLMLQELIKKQYDMEKEIKRLKQISFRDSGTTTVFQKLESISMTFDFESWRDLIKIKEKDLTETFQHGITHGILSILKASILEFEGEVPIRAFDESPDSIYIYQNSTWIKMAQDDFKKLIHKVNQLMIQRFKSWSDSIKNSRKLVDFPIEEYVFIIFDKNIKINEIKNGLYEAIKT
tara:strand:- start:504 stop:1196 length:693 start_codon:yes stop_codon:yes gene_type:complete